MRLLNVKTHQLEDAIVTDTKFPPYSILSHTWGQEEVSFQDLTKGDELLQQLAGYTKILGCCAKSASEGFEHTWIDTCCIDKSSSAELSEAINSMFRWYSKAQVCYAYLSDVDGIGEDSPEKDGSSFRRSRWFTRGWTLQELLAPVEVVFLNRDWEEIGTKSSLASVIASFTRIDAGALKKPLCGSEAVSHHCAGYSIAQKMCWAAWRKTTREEDRAYSLMGLFGVNMPLLYGEGGEKAFARLQSQIMEQSSDDSIFAWS
ncbi:heterokaryon incompatibility protein-domain-containing protein, partial [Cladorrhinum sp. PSN332]